MSDLKKKAGKTIKCSQCRKTAAINNNPYRPFCSERCKMIDLGSWLTEQYKVGEEKDAESEEG